MREKNVINIGRILALLTVIAFGVTTVYAALPKNSVPKSRKKAVKTERQEQEVNIEENVDIITPTDTLGFTVNEQGDTIFLSVEPAKRHGRLTEQDFEEVAAELGVEVAAIKAIVEIEAGRSHNGFWAENKPIINFDLSVFRKMAAKNKVSLAAAAKSHPVIFSAPNAAKYGSQQAGQQARLDAARAVHNLSAIEGTFWGMFQIGGFNWKKCGASSPDEFVELMSRSERDQLELFANMMKNTGLLKHLKNKDWASFARIYNGPSYAKRGYHTRMASAYARYKNKK